MIVVDIDTLRADHLGCYGYSRPTSPNLDAFAEESILFEWAFSQAPNTPPSQASILTGLYPSTHGMVYDEDRIPEAAVTLAEALAAGGYTTAGFHDGGYLSDDFGMGQGFGLYDNNRGGGLARIGPKVLQWLRDHQHEKFLLFAHTYDTHTPYAPPPPFEDLFLDGVPEPTPGFIPNPEQMEAIRLSKYSGEERQLPPNDLAYAMALYDAEIRYVDTWFGELMTTVRELGLDETAVIVVISDHGEEFQEHGSVLHEKLYATVTRIPFMVRMPGGADARRVSRLVQGLDLMPTLLDLAGVEIPDRVQGTSLVPLLRGEAVDGRAVAFGESPYFGVRRSVALGDLRLLLTRQSGSVELYDYTIDPLEQIDLAPTRPGPVEEMRRLLDRWEAEVTAAALEPEGDETLDEATKEQLEALGYIQ